MAHTVSIERWIHDHTFGQDTRRVGERRTLIVILITAVTMVIEVVAGLVFGSMALLADGLHMASHASALTISAFAYYYTRRHARDARFNFGTGKVNTLAAFASAVLLVVFAIVMVGESVKRFISPVHIEFNPAILVAVLGLVVNGVCLLILKGRDHGHHHGDHGHDEHSHDHGSDRHQDHNLWSAYLHVLADALTSVLAIFALLAGKYFGLMWLDPFMGILGAALVIRWSYGLVCSSTRVLLDMQSPELLRQSVRSSIEKEDDNRITDLHIWAVGPNIFAAEIAVITSVPKDPDHYCKLLPQHLGLVHVTVEVRRCPSVSA